MPCPNFNRFKIGHGWNQLGYGFEGLLTDGHGSRDVAQAELVNADVACRQAALKAAQLGFKFVWQGIVELAAWDIISGTMLSPITSNQRGRITGPSSAATTVGSKVAIAGWRSPHF